MSAIDDLLIILSSYHGGYRLMRRRARGDMGYTRKERERYGIRDRNISEGVERVMLSRLKEKGFVANEKRGVWELTAKGLVHVRTLRADRERSTRTASAPGDLIIAFDIPEIDARKRRWLRVMLKSLHFHLLQKSLWFGPGPLPESFITELRVQRILSHLKFFSAQEKDVV